MSELGVVLKQFALGRIILSDSGPSKGQILYYPAMEWHKSLHLRTLADELDALNELYRAIKVFQVDETTFMAGRTAEECVALYLSEYGGETEYIEDFGPAKELTPEQLEKQIVMTGEDHEKEETFRQALDNMIASGRTFPEYFAGEI